MMDFDDLDRIIKNAIDHTGKPTTDYLVQWARGMVERLTDNRLLQLYCQHIDCSNAHNTRPEHAIGEKLWAVMCLASFAAGRSDQMKLMFFDKEMPPYVGATFAYFLLHSQVYLWSDHTESLADAAPLPKHTISKTVLPSPIMFWSRQRSYIVREPEYFETNWMLVMHSVDRIRILHDEVYCDPLGQRGPNRVNRVEFVLIDVPYGLTWPDNFPEANGWREESKRLLARCSFLASPYTTHEAHGLPRHIRRQMKRAGETPIFEREEENVNVVALRRYAPPPHKPTGDHPGVEWQHHWWVQGFHRAQWYPSEQAHKVIWIAPFVKGDLSKPLLEKIYSVVR
jgi:hypothetical protein